MKRKLYVFLVAIIALLALAACGSKNDETSGNGTEKDSSSGESITLQLAGQSPDDHPSTEALYAFADQVKEKSDGRIEVKVFPASQLGDYTTVYKEIGQGTIDMALITTPSEVDSRLDLLMMPYVVTDYENVEEILSMDGYIAQKMQEFNEEHGVKYLGVHANGFGGIGTTKEIPNLTDLGADKNVLLRTPPMEVFNQPMQDIGFRTVTIPFADLSSALQTGTADGWSGGEASLNYFGFRDIIKYFYATNDFFNADAFYINQDLFDSLNEEDQSIILEASNDLMFTSFETANNYDEEYRELLKEEGIEVVELSKEEIETLANYVRETTWSTLKKQMTDELIDGLIETLE